MKTAYLWERGESSVNEDSLVLQQVETKGGTVTLAAVCDGIGGLKEGEVASGYVAERLIVWFYKELLPMVQRQKKGKKLYNAGVKMLWETDEQLKEYGQKKKIKLGTTVTVLLIVDCRYYLFHVGDSRAYKRKWQLRQLTREEGEGQFLYHCIGAGGWKKPQWKTGKIRGKTSFLLCTDGFCKKLTEEEIKIVTAPFGGQEEGLARRLKEAGKQITNRGMKDNATAIVLFTE